MGRRELRRFGGCHHKVSSGKCKKGLLPGVGCAFHKKENSSLFAKNVRCLGMASKFEYGKWYPMDMAPKVEKTRVDLWTKSSSAESRARFIDMVWDDNIKDWFSEKEGYLSDISRYAMHWMLSPPPPEED
jgi:hypothetical protein